MLNEYQRHITRVNLSFQVKRTELLWEEGKKEKSPESHQMYGVPTPNASNKYPKPISFKQH